ncbi:helix-turn-helix transcriptional regulator [Curtobacterium sp. 24E2]|nr:helix-turn-helix transcriptional regulator [Curtobacterium sp. 24E2]
MANDSANGTQHPQPNLAAMQAAFRERRAQLGITIDEVASRSGIDRRDVLRLANGEVRGSISAWWAIARAVETPLSDLSKRLDDPTDPS